MLICYMNRGEVRTNHCKEFNHRKIDYFLMESNVLCRFQQSERPFCVTLTGET